MRDIEVTDSELRLLLAIRHVVHEAESRPPSTAHIDELLDERTATAPKKPSRSLYPRGSFGVLDHDRRRT
jgi:hypothetical protein